MVKLLRERVVKEWDGIPKVSEREWARESVVMVPQ